MKVVLANAGHFLRKKRCNVFSIDVYPGNEEYIVTGGQDRALYLWQIKEAETKEIGKYAKHAGAILCIRFSSDGKVLATAADDGNVIIWDVQEKENVLCLSYRVQLSDHQSDVSSISWSEKYLITGGYSGDVFVYEANGFALIKKLEKHKKGCKGISFSPSGEYLSTYGDEGELFLYNNGLEKISSAQKPFKDIQLESFFCRMDWSPDEKYLVCGLAFAEKKNAAVIFSTTLSQEYTLIGHTAPVEAVAFSSRVWKKEDRGFYLLASGSQDRSVCIWASGMKKPLFLLKELTEQPIMDLRWSRNGYVLAGCSYDGSIFLLIFTENDFKSLSFSSADLEKDSAHAKETAPETDDAVDFPAPNPDLDLSLNTRTNLNTSTKKDTKTNEDEKDNEKNDKNLCSKKKIVLRHVYPLNSNVSENNKIQKDMAIYAPKDNKEASLLEPQCLFEIRTFYEKHIYIISVDKNINRISVQRDGNKWFYLDGMKIKTVAAEKSIMAIAYSSYNCLKEGQIVETVWIYDLNRCVQIIPAISVQNIVSIDVQDNRILFVMPGSFKIIDLNENTCIEDMIVRHTDALSVVFDRTYFLLAFYTDGSVQFYDWKMRLWFIFSLSSQSVYSDAHIETGADLEYTLELLENRCLIGISYRDWSLVEESLLQILHKVASIPEYSIELMNRVDGVLESLVLYTGESGIYFLMAVLEKVKNCSSIQNFVNNKIQQLDMRLSR